MIYLKNDIAGMLVINKQKENPKKLQYLLPEGITVILERWHFPDGVRITKKRILSSVYSL